MALHSFLSYVVGAHSGRYDFFYLPIDFKNRCNLGYAFVNFKNASTTAEFYKEFHSKSWEEFNSKKVSDQSFHIFIPLQPSGSVFAVLPDSSRSHAVVNLLPVC